MQPGSEQTGPARAAPPLRTLGQEATGERRVCLQEIRNVFEIDLRLRVLKVQGPWIGHSQNSSFENVSDAFL